MGYRVATQSVEPSNQWVAFQLNAAPLPANDNRPAGISGAQLSRRNGTGA